ncbi:MAG: hypothetical protein E7660_00070 [Ruminococcaceae bacterium]|nr:hypothetical protein [Oscillospiraceae bacterium]
MKKRIKKTLSALLALFLLLGTVVCFPVSAGEENAPVIIKSEFYDNAKKTGNELPVSDLSDYVNDGISGGFGTPYTPTVYRDPRYTVYKVYVQIAEGKTASDYSFRILCGEVDTNGEYPISSDRYITRASVLGSSDTNIAITEEVVDGISCVVCTYTLAHKPSVNFDVLTDSQTDGSADLTQLSRIFCKVTDISTKKISTTEDRAFYIFEKYAKSIVQTINSFIDENYNLGLLTSSVYYKNNEGVYTNEGDGAVRLPGDKIELALSVPDLSDVPHITGMTPQAMNSNYSNFSANSPEMCLEWYGANQSEKGEDYEEVYLGSSTYALHELFHEWYYEWQESGNYILGTDTVSALHPETTYSITDELSVVYKYVYCKMIININFGAISAYFGTDSDYFALPGFAEEITPEIIKGDVNDDGEVTAKDSIILKKYISGATDNINFDNADMNDDESIDAKDSMLLKKLMKA